METEAYQKIDPPIDFANCRAVQLSLQSGERSLGTATMQLVGESRVATLEPGFFGMRTSPSEVLEFSVPPMPEGLRVIAIRVAFQGNPAKRNQSARVAIEQFTLMPRF